MKLIKLSLSFLLVVLCLSGCGGGSSDSGGAQEDMGTRVRSIVAIGDSIGTGSGLATPWPDLIKNSLDVPVVNNSVRSKQTTYGLSVIKGLLDNHNPSHVTILLGTNDAIHGSVSNAIANLQSMVDIARARNMIVIVGTLPPVTGDATINSRSARISEGIRSLSGARIAAVRDALGNGRDTIADGVHPNQRGQDAIAEAFLAEF